MITNPHCGEGAEGDTKFDPGTFEDDLPDLQGGLEPPPSCIQHSQHIQGGRQYWVHGQTYINTESAAGLSIFLISPFVHSKRKSTTLLATLCVYLLYGSSLMLKYSMCVKNALIISSLTSTAVLQVRNNWAIITYSLIIFE